MISFRINSETLEEFKKEAKKRGISQSDLFLKYQERYKEHQGDEAEMYLKFLNKLADDIRRLPTYRE